MGERWDRGPEGESTSRACETCNSKCNGQRGLKESSCFLSSVAPDFFAAGFSKLFYTQAGTAWARQIWEVTSKWVNGWSLKGNLILYKICFLLPIKSEPLKWLSPSPFSPCSNLCWWVGLERSEANWHSTALLLPEHGWKVWITHRPSSLSSSLDLPFLLSQFFNWHFFFKRRIQWLIFFFF